MKETIYDWTPVQFLYDLVQASFTGPSPVIYVQGFDKTNKVRNSSSGVLVIEPV